MCCFVYLHCVDWCLAVCVPVWTLRFSSPSGSKCHHLQCLLLRAKANALRLNELSHTELLQMAALTSAQLVIIQAFASHSQPAESVWLIWGSSAGCMWQLPFKGWCTDAPGRCTAGAVISVCYVTLFIWDSVK